MKKLLVLTVAGMLIAGAMGCQCRRFFPWRNATVGAPSSVTYDRAMPPSTYSDSAVMAPSGGCGPGCNSCGGN